MGDAIWFAVGLLVGAAGASLWVVARSATSHAAQKSDLESRLFAAEGLVTELRSGLERQATEIGSLRAELDGERQSRVKAETRLDEEQRNVAEQKRLVGEAQQSLSETFKALSSDALKGNSEAFLQLAKRSLDALVAEAKGDLGKRQEAIHGLVKPLGESLARYQGLLRDVEAKRQKDQGSLCQRLEAMVREQGDLKKETGNLVSALRRPQVRGAWGEMTLHRVAELSGMSAHCDFSEQVSVSTEDGRLRPDMVVHVAGGISWSTPRSRWTRTCLPYPLPTTSRV